VPPRLDEAECVDWLRGSLRRIVCLIRESMSDPGCMLRWAGQLGLHVARWNYHILIGGGGVALKTSYSGRMGRNKRTK
jgi:hypothetical protein